MHAEALVCQIIQNTLIIRPLLSLIIELIMPKNVRFQHPISHLALIFEVLISMHSPAKNNCESLLIAETTVTHSVLFKMPIVFGRLLRQVCVHKGNGQDAEAHVNQLMKNISKLGFLS